MRRILISSFTLAALALSGLAADSGLVQLLPANPRVVAGIHVDQSISSPFGRYLLDQMKDDDAEFRRFVDLSGFDPRRDLREVIVANYASTNPESKKERVIIAAKGSFDAARIRTAMLNEGAKIGQYLGVELVAGKNGHEVFSFLDGGTAIAGDEDSVKEIIARQKGATNATAAGLAPEARRRIDEMSAKYDAWMFTNTPIASIVGNIPDPAANSAVKGDMLRSIQSASGGVKLGANIIIDAEAQARSDKDATALHDVLKFISGMVTLAREEGPRQNTMASLFEHMQVSTKGSQVTFSITIPQYQVEKMIENNKKPRSSDRSKI